MVSCASDYIIDTNMFQRDMNKLFVDLAVADYTVCVQLHTGAPVSLLNRQTYGVLRSPPWHSMNVKLSACNVQDTNFLLFMCCALRMQLTFLELTCLI